MPRVLIGRDTRESGPHIAERIARGLASAGSGTGFGRGGHHAGSRMAREPRRICRRRGDLRLAQSLSRQWREADFVVGHEISGRCRSGNRAFDSFSERPVIRQSAHARRMQANRIRTATKNCTKIISAGLRAAVFPGAKFAGMKIVLDCANGAASKLAPQLFRLLGAEVTAINNTPDGNNINAGCGSLHPEAMQKRVVESGAALGVAFDGDADRALFASASGKLVDGDGVLLVAGRYLKSAGKLKGNVIVGTTMANLGLERALDQSGLTLVRTAVGDRYVLEEMLRIGANLGGEQSGHILFLDDATTGDGMLTAVKMASIVSIAGPLDSLVADLKIFPQKIVNVRVKSKPPLESLPEVSRLLAEGEKALGNSGRIVLRYSGTEPLARVMVEAEREEDVSRWTDSLASALRTAIGA